LIIFALNSLLKISEKEDRYSMPVSFYVHHGLVDGFHVGKFVEEFQRLLVKG
jgi:chloramphenicol O-acetyltransferase type A